MEFFFFLKKNILSFVSYKVFIYNKKVTSSIKEQHVCFQSVSAPLKHFIKIRQVGDLQHSAVLAEALRRTEERSERFEDDVLNFPTPQVRLGILKHTSHLSVQFFVVEQRKLKCNSGVLSYLLLSRLGLQDVLLPDGVEHAALLAEVSEALLFIVPVHLHSTTKQNLLDAVCASRISSYMRDWQDIYLSGQPQDEQGETLHDWGVIIKQQWQPC